MVSSIKAAALAVFLSASTAAGVGYDLRLAASWDLLTVEQQQVIDLVAKDIWDSERSDRPVSFEELGTREKTNLRAEAMERLGFQPPRVAGYEA